jgi:hypothetical protein
MARRTPTTPPPSDFDERIIDIDAARWWQASRPGWPPPFAPAPSAASGMPGLVAGLANGPRAGWRRKAEGRRLWIMDCPAWAGAALRRRESRFRR